MANSIGAGYLEDIAGIPSAYTNLLESLGYMNTPFQTVDQGFASQENFQRSLKSILDRQLSAFGGNAPGGNLNYLPLNLRNIYSAAAPAMTDPRYGIIGAPGFFSGGYQQGQLPGGHSAAYQSLLDQRGVPPPNVALPSPVSQAANNSIAPPNMNNPANRLVGHYTVALPGGGSMTVNASDPDAARVNAGVDPNSRVETGSYRF